MTPHKRKIVNRAIFKETIIVISISREVRIKAMNQSDIDICNFFMEILERTQCNAQLVEQWVLAKFDFVAIICLIIGNTTQELDDLKDLVPTIADCSKMEL